MHNQWDTFTMFSFLSWAENRAGFSASVLLGKAWIVHGVSDQILHMEEFCLPSGILEMFVGEF